MKHHSQSLGEDGPQIRVTHTRSLKEGNNRARMERERERHGRETKMLSRGQGKCLQLIPKTSHFTLVGPGLLNYFFTQTVCTTPPWEGCKEDLVKPRRSSTFQKGNAFCLTACSTVHSTLVTNHLTCRTLSAFHFFLALPGILLQHVFNRSLSACNEQCFVERSPRQ